MKNRKELCSETRVRWVVIMIKSLRPPGADGIFSILFQMGQATILGSLVRMLCKEQSTLEANT